MPHQERVNIAVFIDFDNIEIGVKSTLGEHFDIGTILEALKERGEVVTKIAYADWTRAGEYSRALTQHAIRLVQRNLTPGGDKNGADINLALDALEMAFTHPHINAYVIVGGDSDFLSLVEKLKQYDKKVFVVGGRAFTSVILQRNCHEFIAYENLVRKPVRVGRGTAVTSAAPVAQAFPIVRRALKILADREVSPQTGLLKSTLLQLDSTFSERNYGASSFLDFAEKLAQAGLVQLKHAGRSVMVELNPGFAEDSDSAPDRARTLAEGELGGVTTPAATQAGGNGSAQVAAGPGGAGPYGAGPGGGPGGAGPGGGAGAIGPGGMGPGSPDAPPLGDNAEGVRAAGRIMAAATTARWPMYLRNVKQILRAASFDERRYGFGGLLDLLRACQREGLVRLERDRRGGLRVLQGSASRPPVATPIEVAAAASAVEMAGSLDADRANRAVMADSSETDVIDVQPVAVIDTTAELLGRAKPKRPRLRTAAVSQGLGQPPRAGAGPRASRKAAPQKRSGRPKKKAPAEVSDEPGS
ncbi:MAG: hypothetical protein DMF89_11615 [Acidobacteria bacterium]|nr:MAG: hypothetical protein DMF89_11615 [Acidobacteriota bacterium]